MFASRFPKFLCQFDIPSDERAHAFAVEHLSQRLWQGATFQRSSGSPTSSVSDALQANRYADNWGDGSLLLGSVDSLPIEGHIVFSRKDDQPLPLGTKLEGPALLTTEAACTAMLRSLLVVDDLRHFSVTSSDISHGGLSSLAGMLYGGWANVVSLDRYKLPHDVAQELADAPHVLIEQSDDALLLAVEGVRWDPANIHARSALSAICVGLARLVRQRPPRGSS